ncbi:MAG TPA: MarR family transcriptional regulator [Baekduia sp.]|nr:MarR family transcriptional regulator [Baekduia sp.]
MSSSPWTTAGAGRRLAELADHGEPESAWELLDSLLADAGTMCGDNDLQRIARAQGQVTRWLLSLEGRRGDLVALLDHQLRSLATTLDAGWRTTSLRADQERGDRASAPVRQQVVEQLAAAGALRPSEIARRLGRDPAQISRALRTLVHEGQVQRRVSPGHDHRAVTYALAPAHEPALAA